MAGEKATGPNGEVELVPLTEPTSWVTSEDYPSEALRRGQEGKVAMVLTVGPDGVPRSCTVNQTSGSPALDQGSCALLMQRARYKPPLDSAGRPVEVTYLRNINWVIPRGVDGLSVPVTIQAEADGHACSAEIRGQQRRLTRQLCEALVKSVQAAGRPLEQPVLAEFPDTPAFLEPVGS